MKPWYYLATSTKHNKNTISMNILSYVWKYLEIRLCSIRKNIQRLICTDNISVLFADNKDSVAQHKVAIEWKVKKFAEK